MSKSLGQWLKDIEALHPAEIELGLDRVRRVYDRLDQLQPEMTVFTVAGTNGKGSTVKTIEAIGVTLGKRVGTYTSPHLLSYNERVQVDQVNASDQSLVEAFEEVEAARQGIPLTYFEFGTLAALVIFARANPEWVVLEVGLGGRLDAVNIVAPDIAVLTAIDMDHESWLGNTREKIGYEKAGIIRTDSRVICGDAQPPETVIDKAREARASFWRGREFGVDEKGIWFAQYDLAPGNKEGLRRIHACAPASLPVLIDNFITGIQAVAAAGETVTEPLLEQAAGAIQLSGRQQLLGEGPWLLLDVGHNPQAARALANRLRDLKEQLPVSGVTCLVGMLADKNHVSSLMELLPFVDQWWPVTLDAGYRSTSGQQLASVLAEAGANVGPVSDSPRHAYRRLRDELSQDALLVVFGSFYTVSEILSET